MAMTPPKQRQAGPEARKRRRNSRAATPTKMMKILHVIASVDPRSGGPIEGIVQQDKATMGIGVRHIVSCDAPDAPFLADYPVKVHALGVRSGTKARNRLLAHYGYTPHLIPWLKAHARNYDAVVVNGLWNFATFASARALPGGPTPYFVFTHGMMDPWFRRTYPLKHLAKQAFWTFCEGPLVAGSRAVLFTTEEERRLARGQFLGWRYNEAVVGYGTTSPPPATPEQAAAFRQSAPALGDRPYLLFLSRIHQKKGCDLLVEAFGRMARDQNLDLVIAGPDQVGWVGELRALAVKLGLEDRIHWPGALFGDAKWGAMRGAEAFILPSHQENFGIVVAEALGCGTPVLISDKVNIWREVVDGGAGLVAPDTTDGCAALIDGWLTLGGPERTAMRQAARRVFDTHFDVAQTGARLFDLIQEAT